MRVPPTVRFGSADVPSVVAAQRNLNVADAREQSAGRAGLSTCPLTEDGEFGTAVAQATVEFQAIRALVTDGIIGPNTWNQLLAGVDPTSGVGTANFLPIEGTTRWSISVDVIAAVLGKAPTAAQLDGLNVAVGGNPATRPAVSPDRRMIYFTPPAGEDGSADLVITGSDGSSFILAGSLPYTASIPAALEAMGVAVAISIQEVALFTAALEVGRLSAFVDGVAAALRDYQDLLAGILTRLQDPGGSPSALDENAWVSHMATRARMVADVVNEQCRINLATDAIADLDGLPFGGADDEPTLDTAAQVLLLTALENVIVPSVVDLTA
jgi:hypothetical protein